MSESSTVHSSPIQGSSAPTSIPQESNKMENLAKMTLIETRLSNEKKSVFLAYVLWFFFGSFGVHCFYLGKRTLPYRVDLAWNHPRLRDWI